MEQPRNILVVTYWSFSDALIQTYTLPYLKIIARHLPAGSTIHLVTLDKTPLADQPDLAEWNIELVRFQYKAFGIAGAWMGLRILLRLIGLIRRKRIRTIHTWCTPGGMIGYILSRLTGRELILDSFEPHAEPMAEGGTWNRNGLAFKTLFRYERLQLKRAKEVICAVEGMAAYSQKVYGITKPRYFAKPACVDLELFSEKNRKHPELLEKLGLQDKIVCVYAGKFGGLYLEQQTFDFFRAAFDHWGDRFRVLLLTSHSREEIAAYAEKAELPANAIVQQFVAHSDIPDYMGLADFAICPMKPLPSRRYGTPIKDGEYWALGLPVVITPGISDDSDIIAANDAGSIIPIFTPEAYARSVNDIARILSADRTEVYKRIRPLAERYRNFAIAEKVYAAIYASNPDSE